MRGPDLDKQRSEERHTLKAFLEIYNTDLPLEFPRASLVLLKKFKEIYPSQFETDGLWSLDVHRKKVMDWLRTYLKVVEV